MKNVLKTVLISALFAASVVHAANPGPGLSSANDVSLDKDHNAITPKNPADDFILVQGQNINPVQSTAGFASQLFSAYNIQPSDWVLAGTVETSNGGTFSDKVLSDQLTFSLTQTTGTNGTWTISNSRNVNTVFDLVLSFHAGNNVGSFFFDHVTAPAGQTISGDWKIQWLNNANAPNSTPAFSNVAFYTAPVPEPSSYAMMLGGLALMGYVARRRRQA
jgi:hypothetical protein